MRANMIYHCEMSMATKRGDTISRAVGVMMVNVGIWSVLWRRKREEKAGTTERTWVLEDDTLNGRWTTTSKELTS